jgi:anti-sigma factor RsiW
MTHDEARVLIGAAPDVISPALATHLAQCPECVLFQRQMQQMDHDLRRVFAAPLAPREQARIVRPPLLPRASPKVPIPRHSGMMALAASLVLSIGMGIIFWTLRPEPSLAAGVLEHVARESASWSEVTPMTAAATAEVLAGAGVSVDQADTTVTYARSCLFNGHWVPHLVVRTAAGPVTVMVLNREHIAARQSFRQNGYSGILVPAPRGGTLAVIAQGDPDMDALSRALGPHLHWTH